MELSRRERGFTLIEVLVALAIVAVAMSATVRVAGLMTHSGMLLRDRSMALMAAQGRLAELRLEGRYIAGRTNVECDQGRLRLRCEQVVVASEVPGLMRVTVKVWDRQREAPPLALLHTLLARPARVHG
ncbi:type II secretion system minor pseudopilin GspI [Pseudomonas sp. S75]|uniref:type II secretion system minor pseudopilin GspI n=1 Tax=unclassified Pseudomonas TaxID=196821 RepID=UPI0019065696|nr:MULTISPECIES: type II secretion system minor pseudopilin GspI [unclassified Pseudomonas]MBJ9975509.1 type II secretion system minor pseudopilin GspI [Pseudomonas sp. S30]MBK0153060.1 type II secretion system minor pseudopilin GspI [Pseudomonas sp. S75]